MDASSEEKLGLVCPALAEKVRLLSDTLLPEKIHFRVTQGLRSWAEQEHLYQQGRTAPGKIVTNAPPGHSWHQFGLAVDVVLMDPLPDWDLSHPVWKRLITEGESIGLYSGDQFTHKDEPHFQLTGVFPVSPNDRVRQLFLANGLQAVWLAAGLITFQ